MVAASSLKMETHFTLIPNGVKETFFDYMDKNFSDSCEDGVASEYLLLNGTRISETISCMYRYYLKQDMNVQEVRIAYGHQIVLSLCNLCKLKCTAESTVSSIDEDVEQHDAEPTPKRQKLSSKKSKSDYDIYWVSSPGVRILIIEMKTIITDDAIAQIVGYYMTPKRTSRAARLSGKEQIPVIGLILSATEWQLVIFPFSKKNMFCINGVVAKKQKLVSEGPIFGMLSPQLWSLLVAFCRSFPHIKTCLTTEDLTAGQTLCRRKTYSSLVTTPALEHEKELIRAVEEAKKEFEEEANKKAKEAEEIINKYKARSEKYKKKYKELESGMNFP